MNHYDRTWKQILMDKGFNPATVNTFIGFVTWNKDEPIRDLGKEISEVLSSHEGKVIAKDTLSKKYNDAGLLLFSAPIPDEVANKIFDTIMTYEQEEVYDL